MRLGEWALFILFSPVAVAALIAVVTVGLLWWRGEL
jgi:hypothetical protein